MKTIKAMLIAGAGFIAAFAYGVMSMSPPQYDIARGAATIATLCAMAGCILWFFNTDEAIIWRVLVGMITGCVTLGGLPVFLNWVNTVEYHNVFAPTTSVPP